MQVKSNGLDVGYDGLKLSGDWSPVLEIEWLCIIGNVSITSHWKSPVLSFDVN